jgi:hypothetical protein
MIQLRTRRARLPALFLLSLSWRLRGDDGGGMTSALPLAILSQSHTLALNSLIIFSRSASNVISWSPEDVDLAQLKATSQLIPDSTSEITSAVIQANARE